MGERKGTNKYYPPDYDPKKGGLNKFMGTHALRERARKLHLGIMIIRFEMPYNIWCEGCNNHIGMGVRYNAEKKKIGMYYSTPVYQFRMKCHLCNNHFEIKTDPANLDYVIVSGARRQERRWDPNENGQVVPDDKQVIHKLADDAMFKLQHGVEDQKKLKDVTPTLSKLENLQERWKDDYMANKALRDIFRSRKRELQEQHNKDKDFLKKRSLDIPLLQESEDDAKVASLIRLQPALSVDERQQEKRSEIDKKSQFPFPLLGTSKVSAVTSTVSTSNIDLGGGQGSSSKASEQHSCLHQRRLSLGIKLKRDLSSTITSESTTITLADNKNDGDNGESIQSSSSDGNIDLDEQASDADFTRINDDDTLPNSKKESESTQSERSCSPALSDPENPLNVYTKSSSNRNPKSSGSSKGLLSSLVSYSDDSENSSFSGSENEEIR